MATSPTQTEAQDLGKIEKQPSTPPENGRQTESSSGDVDLDKAPDGGLEAWLVAAGGASIFFSCLGFANSFGVFQEYYMTHQLKGWSPDDVAWIGSLAAFIQFAAGAIGGPLFDRLGAWVVRPAAIAYIFAIMMISLCREYWQFMLTQGVLTGTIMAFLQLPAMGAVSQFFDKKRAAALGVVVSGSSIGGVVIPIALSKLLNGSSIGFGWSVRIIGFLIMPFMFFSTITVKAHLPPRPTNFFIGAAFKNTRFVLLIASLFFMMLGMFTPLFFIPTYAVSRGVETTLASYLLAIVNASSTFGRIIPGIVADKYGRMNTFSVAGFSTGIVILCLNQATTTAGLVVYSVVFGFTSGMVISGASAAVASCPLKVQDMGTYLGMGMALSSFAALIGPPVNGVLVDKYDGFSQVAIFSGVMSLAGGCVVLAAKAVTPEGILARN